MFFTAYVLCSLRSLKLKAERQKNINRKPDYRKGSYIVITKAQFVSVFRSRLARMGVHNPSRFRGHSFRRGGATWHFHAGVPGELIQIFGDWASDAYKCYLEFSEGSPGDG